MKPQEGEQIPLIPSQCPRFVAAWLTVGGTLQKGSPGISNTYDKARKYDPDEPGTISYHLSRDKYDPLALAKVWRNPDMELAEVVAIKTRLVTCKDLATWEAIADDIEVLHVNGAVATISLFAQGKIGVDSRTVSDEEEQAAKVLSGMSASMKAMTRPEGGKVAAIFDQVWNRAMFAWLKAWISNYQEVKVAWKLAEPSIKIERDGQFPIVLRKNTPNLTGLLKRWAN